ncbi:MAG: hypothetical protein GWN99_13640 [Gemmatimonadetes bacterium]|uniref:Glycine zipper domain-containing protein n=1 Tax=Candidatus Kutchimonas denitrificans TaxID=3056748 RepID=A0AAE5CCP3_9BACT|nr:hypothetical protein [Gemmatimonadota bacterium]NIR75930.1 hypothetical protein [Candidatus Kutchimonas denitrificans]NIS02088.1 hypothetical protein [Gemmatimonadota bacterium]NIT67913.1 hypothetical protein [Gemmatimonadota bacterium]NIU53907.1 hypothetical protein [Gemmatimonadota bacterium]
MCSRPAILIAMISAVAVSGVPIAHAQTAARLGSLDSVAERSWLSASVVQPESQDQGSVFRPLLFGALFGAGGFLAGALVGDAVDDECDNSTDYCIPTGVVLGAATGGTFGLALGVHVGNRSRGNMALDSLAAAAVWGLGITVAIVSDDDTARAITLAAIPIVQLGVTVGVERASGR